MHKHGPRGDMGRNERQVIALVMKKGTNVTNMTKFAEMIDILEHHVETNLDQAQMKKIFTRYRHTKKIVSTLEIKGNIQIINSTWYYVVPDNN